MKRPLIPTLLVSLMILCVPEIARGATVTGKVFNDKGDPLPAVTVIIPALEIGGFTDANGEFLLVNIPGGTHTIEFRFLGFRTVKSEITVAETRPTVLEIKMIAEVLLGDEIIVSGERELAGGLTGTSQSVTVLTPIELDLEVRRGQTLGETLEALPGVTVLTTGPAVSKPVIRGVHSARVLVLNAGISQEGQQWGGDHAPEIDPFSPARIEVLKGASSVQYGAGAIGGVVRIEPPDLPREPGMGGQLNSGLYSNSRQGGGSLLLQGALSRFPGLSWRVQGSLRRASDARTPTHIISNSGIDERNYSASVGFSTDWLQSEAYFSHVGSWIGVFQGAHIGNTTDLQRAIDRGAPATRGTFTYEVENPRQRVDHDLLSVRNRINFEGRGNLELRYGQQYNRREEWDAHARGGGEPTRPGIALGLQTHNVELIYQHLNFGRWFGKIGLSGTRQRNKRFKYRVSDSGLSLL